MAGMEVIIDKEKCTTPAKCRKCLEVCPQAVFKLHVGRIEKYKLASEDDWHLDSWYWPSCTGCMECVKACPLKAIKVKKREGVEIKSGNISHGKFG